MTNPGPAKQYPVRLEHRITEDDRAKLDKLCRDRGISKSEFFRQAIREAARKRKRGR